MKKLKIITLPVGQMKANCYLLADTKSRETVIVDPGDDAEYIERIIADEQLQPVKILATHGHVDHVMAVWELSLAYKIPFFINTKDEFLIKNMSISAKHWLGFDPGPPPVISKTLKNGEKLRIRESILEIIETPGHTPGSICLYCQKENMILVGDLIFAGGGVGRTDFSYSNKEDLEKSIEKILQLPEITIFYSGHGESSTLEEYQLAISQGV